MLGSGQPNDTHGAHYGLWGMECASASKLFRLLTAEKRLRAVLVNKYCENCLAHQHSGPSCRSRDRCRVCREPHHTLLHFHEPAQATPPSRSPSNSRSPSSSGNPTTLTSLLQLKSVNVLPTAVVRLYSAEKTF